MSNDLTRLTVNLTPLSRTALDKAAHRTGDSRTDIVNLAVQVYQELIEAGERQGMIRLTLKDLTGAPLYLLSWRQPFGQFSRSPRKWWQLW